MNPVKSFIYLDEYKMYSISSQLFAGLTEQILTQREAVGGESEEQKGPWASGRILANIAMQRITTSEKRSLYDYAYTLFEKKLEDDGRILDVAEDVPTAREMQRAGFVRVRGRAVLGDMENLHTLLKDFNQIGQAIAYVSKDAEQLSQSGALGGGTNVKVKNLAEYARQRGLQQDQKFLEQLAYVLKYGYSGLFQARIAVGESPNKALIFSANLKKEHLRETDQDIVSKYGRKTDRPFTVLGVAVQVSSEPAAVASVNEPDAREQVHMKEALFRMVNAVAALESTFLGRLPNEMILDPIAVYHEV